jgi:hypothetical protein
MVAIAVLGSYLRRRWGNNDFLWFYWHKIWHLCYFLINCNVSLVIKKIIGWQEWDNITMFCVF